ncbi:hypothetical protein B0H13DRAFT_2675335 [Mycena leptocephala]|nr:hypothetical protein B0H13DRAFT_2675335 [Mycena leptocephala]
MFFVVHPNSFPACSAVTGRSFAQRRFHHYAIPTTPVPPHNSLCRLSLDPVRLRTHEYSSTCFKLLPLLTFPCLSQLTFEYAPDNTAEADSFLSFIRRSPGLDTFIASVSNIPPSSIAPCLAAAPALRTLVLQCDIINMLEVLRLLKDSSSFLPRLQTIVIDLVYYFDSGGVATDIEDKLRPLVAALSAGSEENPGLAKLLRCALLLDKYDPAKFSFATYQMLRLEEGGMKIHVEKKAGNGWHIVAPVNTFHRMSAIWAR